MEFIYSHLEKLGLNMRPTNLKGRPELKHSIWMVGGQISVSLVTFVSTFALANWVSEEILGSYRFILAIYASAGVFALQGMYSALQQSVAAGKSGSLRTAWVKKLKYGFAASVFFVGLAVYFYFFTDKTYLWMPLVISGLLLPWTDSYGLYASYLTGLSKFKEVSIGLTIERFFNSLAIMVAALLFPTLIGLVLWYLVSNLCLRYFLYTRALRKFLPNEEVDDSLLSYAKHLTAMSLLGVVTSQLDKYILFFFFGPTALATFWIASIIPQEVGRFIGVVIGTFFPRMVQLDISNVRALVKKLFLVTSLGALLIIGTYYISAETFFRLFIPIYEDSYKMSILLMFAYAFVPHTIVWSIFTAKKHVKELYIYSIVEPLLTITLYGIFIPMYGVWGLVYALCVKTLIMNIASLHILYKYKL